MAPKVDASGWAERWRPEWPTTIEAGFVDILTPQGLVSRRNVPSLRLRGEQSPGPPGDVEALVRHPDFPGWLFFVTFSPAGVPVGFEVQAKFAEPAGPGKVSARIPEAPPVTARFLRSLPLGEIQTAARRGFVDTLSEAAGRALPQLPTYWARVLTERRRPGRAGRSDVDLARVAATYVGHVASGSRSPTKDASLELNISASHLRNLLAAARGRTLLTAPDSGKAGGTLTQKAQHLLRKDRG